MNGIRDHIILLEPDDRTKRRRAGRWLHFEWKLGTIIKMVGIQGEVFTVVESYSG